MSLIQVSGAFMGMLLIAISGYVETFKISRGVFNLIKYFKLTSRKITVSSFKNKMPANSYLIKFLLYILFSFFIFNTTTSNIEMQRYTFLILTVLYFIFDVTLYLEDSTPNKSIEGYLARKSILMVLILSSSIFSLYLLEKVPAGSIYIIALKIVIFLNTTGLIYLYDFLSEKSSEEVLNAFLRKILFYFLLMSLFVSLNSFGSSAQSLIKYGYFSVSIVLVEFMATYVKTNLGFVKINSALNLLVDNLLVYLIIFCVVIAGLIYVV